MLATPHFILSSASKEVTCVLFSARHEHLLYSATRDGDLVVYDLHLRRPLLVNNPSTGATGSKQAIIGVIELADSSLITHTRDGAIHKWTRHGETSGWTPQLIYQKEVYTFCHIRASSDGRTLLVPSTEVSCIDCIDLTTNKRVHTLRPGAGVAAERGLLMNMQMVDSDDRRHILCGYENGEMSLLEMRASGGGESSLSSVDLFQGQPVMCFDYHKAANVGFACSAAPLVHTIELLEEENELKNQPKLHACNSFSLTNPGVNAVRIRTSDGRLLVTGGWDSRVRVFSVTTTSARRKKTPKVPKLLAVLDFHKASVNALDFSPFDGMLAAGSNDGIVSAWNLYNSPTAD